VTPVSIQTALGQTLLLLRKRLEEEQIQLKTEIAENHWVMGDNARLEQVLVNLLTNACDALQGRDDKQIQVTSQSVGRDTIYLTIVDNGSGIDETCREHLFEPFYTTKPMGSGLGLGLAIVAAIIRDLHGTIQPIDSPLGGAGFAITLPAANLNSDIVIEE
jgi:two-component system C4-dicarboxylate transport sensor histidine kinase DctB